MRKFILLLLSLSLPFALSAQLSTRTPRSVVSDFTGKTLKVVSTGSDMLDTFLRESVKQVWNISSYEFCSYGDYKKACGSEDNYFLMVTDAQFNKESTPGIQMLSIFKGKAGAVAGNLSSMYEIVALPFCPVDEPDGRETDFLPVLISALQDQVILCMDKSLNPVTGVKVRNQSLLKKWDKRCAIREDDFAETPGVSQRAVLKRENIDVVTGDEIVAFVEKRNPGTLVGYVVAPNKPVNGARCFCMLFDSSTWELYFLKSHKLSIKNPAGFGKDEIESIISHQ